MIYILRDYILISVSFNPELQSLKIRDGLNEKLLRLQQLFQKIRGANLGLFHTQIALLEVEDRIEI